MVLLDPFLAQEVELKGLYILINRIEKRATKAKNKKIFFFFNK
jgi:hypothetical protein